MIPRLKTAYNKDIISKLMSKLNLKNKHEVPKIEKIILNMGQVKTRQTAKNLNLALMIWH